MFIYRRGSVINLRDKSMTSIDIGGSMLFDRFKMHMAPTIFTHFSQRKILTKIDTIIDLYCWFWRTWSNMINSSHFIKRVWSAQHVWRVAEEPAQWRTERRIDSIMCGRISVEIFTWTWGLFFLLQSHKTFNASTTECINFLLRLSALRFVVKVLVFTAKFWLRFSMSYLFF